MNKSGEIMQVEVAQATAEDAYSTAHQARRRAGRALWLAVAALLVSTSAIATVIGYR